MEILSIILDPVRIPHNSKALRKCIYLKGIHSCWLVAKHILFLSKLSYAVF